MNNNMKEKVIRKDWEGVPMKTVNGANGFPWQS